MSTSYFYQAKQKVAKRILTYVEHVTGILNMYLVHY